MRLVLLAAFAAVSACSGPGEPDYPSPGIEEVRAAFRDAFIANINQNGLRDFNVLAPVELSARRYADALELHRIEACQWVKFDFPHLQVSGELPVDRGYLCTATILWPPTGYEACRRNEFVSADELRLYLQGGEWRVSPTSALFKAAAEGYKCVRKAELREAGEFMADAAIRKARQEYDP